MLPADNNRGMSPLIAAFSYSRMVILSLACIFHGSRFGSPFPLTISIVLGVSAAINVKLDNKTKSIDEITPRSFIPSNPPTMITGLT